MKGKKQHVFMIGAKSLGAYGGYETFVDKLVEYHQNNNKIQYHVACKFNGDGYMDETKLGEYTKLSDNEFIYRNAHCYKVYIPQLGPAQAIYYDVRAILQAINIIKKENIESPIIYIMACRIGPFMKFFHKKIKGLGGIIYINPDGHEWKREKWSKAVRKYWKLSEKLMVENCDLVVCDSINIESYIQKEYQKQNTTFIAYGSETRKSILTNEDSKLKKWYDDFGLKPNDYYLVVGRFVPENNYETMIREFMKSNSTKDFVLITNVNDNFLRELEKKLNYKSDSRIKFVGTLYEKELLMKVRENAYCYFHGHEVGGTNPSLLEALATTRLNLLLDVGFNREVAEEGAIYWTKELGELAKLIDEVDKYTESYIEKMSICAKRRISSHYSWQLICDKYNDIFIR